MAAQSNTDNGIRIFMAMKDIMFEQNGPILAGDLLWKALGYNSFSAFHKALSRKTVPVPVFDIPKRREKFCFIYDVLAWIIDHRIHKSDQAISINNDELGDDFIEALQIVMSEYGPILSTDQIPDAERLLNKKLHAKFYAGDDIPVFKMTSRNKNKYVLAYELIDNLFYRKK